MGRELEPTCVYLPMPTLLTYLQVTAWDELELVTRCGDFEGALSKFARRPPLRAPPLKSSSKTEPILPKPLNTENVPER